MMIKDTYTPVVRPIIGGGKFCIFPYLRALPISLFLLITTAISLSSCEKELDINYLMYDMYMESCSLNETSRDSVDRFHSKFSDFVASNHYEAIHSEYYEPTLDNIWSAVRHFHVEIGGWGEDIHWTFGFDETNRK